MSDKRTVRLILPQCQNEAYLDSQFSTQLLTTVLPPDTTAETIQIPISDRQTADGLTDSPALRQEMTAVQSILTTKRPDHIIMAGGDCTITEAPFDYLSGQYGETLGVLWLDNHPDIADSNSAQYLHEMAVTNLLGKGDTDVSSVFQYPLSPRQIMFGGIDQASLRPMDQAVETLGIRCAPADDLAVDSQSVLTWLREEKIDHVAVHFNCDVLTPTDFKGAGGQLALRQVVRLFSDIGEHAEVVGFSVTEQLPWDVINLRHALSEMTIFQ